MSERGVVLVALVLLTLWGMALGMLTFSAVKFRKRVA